MIIASKRWRVARAVGGEAWVRGAPFDFPIDSLETFFVSERGRPARAVGGEARVRGAPLLFPIDSLESFRHFQRINARSRAWASWDVASAIRSTEAMTAYSSAIKNVLP